MNEGRICTAALPVSFGGSDSANNTHIVMAIHLDENGMLTPRELHNISYLNDAVNVPNVDKIDHRFAQGLRRQRILAALVENNIKHRV